jgi:hypothetical protein
MPVDFLTDEQRAKYGNFNGEPTVEELAVYFFLDDTDKKIIYNHRGHHNRLGFAIQLGTVRFLGTLLPDLTLIPANVISYISQQLGIDKSNLNKYCSSVSRWDHNNEIRQIYGYHDFSEQPHHWEFVRWLYNHAWLTSERPGILFERAVARCRKQKILLPGVTVIERLISQIRERANSRLWRKLSSFPDNNQRKALENLLVIDKKHKTSLEFLRQPSTHESPTGFLKAIERYKSIYAIGAHQWNTLHLPVGKIRSLSRYASTCRTQAIERMSCERRMATLVAFAIMFTISAQDDVIDYMERYFSELFNIAVRKDQKNWLYSKKDMNNSARELIKACSLILDESIPDEKIRDMIFSKVPRERLKSSVGTVNELTKPADQTIEYKELFRYYKSVRKFLPKLLLTIEFKASAAGQHTLSAWKFLSDVESKTGKNKFVGAPTEGISASWKRVVFKNDGRISLCAYTFWIIEKMLEGIKNYDIYLENSDRYNDPRSKLIQNAEWESVRSKVLKVLGWSVNTKKSLDPLKTSLDIAYKNAIKNWDANQSVRIDVVQGKEKIILSRLDKLDEPDSLLLLRKRVNSLLPNTDLPSLLMEIAKLTSFTDQFTHISQNNSRIKDLDISICAVLIANACNIGFEPLVQPGVSALEYDRLTWVEQNYFRSETLQLANAVIIEYLSKLLLTKSWGNGNIASADGLRHVVPLKTIYAGTNPHYFGIGRGVRT